MVAYFRLQTYLFIALGAAAGFLTAVLTMSSIIGVQALFVRLFYLALLTMIGVVLGRLFSSLWANKKLKELNALLYQRSDPLAFLEKFGPVAKNAPVDTAEQVNAQTKIAYAWEALGEMDKGLEALADLKPEALKLHALQCTALAANQRLRLYLMKEDTEAAQKQLEELKELQETATSRAPTLGKSLAECVRLGTCWLSVLNGEPTDLDYIREEIALSQNRIHKSEMLLLLGRALRLAGEEEEAVKTLEEAVLTADGLYAGVLAKEELAIG